jgi:hypothetical protein
MANATSDAPCCSPPATPTSPFRPSALLHSLPLLVVWIFLPGCDSEPAGPSAGDRGVPASIWTLDQEPWEDLLGVSGTTTDALVAAGDGGTVLRYRDGEWVDIGPRELAGRLGRTWSAAPDTFFIADWGGERVHRYQSGEWTTFTLPGCRLYAIWGTSPTDVYSSDFCGTPMRFDGTEWTALAGGPAYVIDLWATGADNLFAVGNEGIHHYDGASWTEMDLPAEVGAGASVWAVDGSGPTNVYALSSELLHYDGSAWSVVPVEAPIGDFFEDVWVGGPDEVVAVGYHAGQGLVTRFDGTAWTTSEVDGIFRTVTGTGGGDVWAVGLNGRVLHFDGTAWTIVRGGLSADLHAVRGGPDGGLYAVGDETILRYDGTGWQPFLPTVGGATSYRAIWAAEAGDLFVVGDGDTPVLRYDGTWHELDSPATSLSDVWGTSPSSVVAVGAGGTIARFDGTGWTVEAEGITSGNVEAVWGADTGEAFAVLHATVYPAEPSVLHFDGESWTGMPVSHLTHDLDGVWGSAPDDVFAVGRDGLILHWDGAEWREMDSGTSEHLLDVRGASATDVYAVGEAGTILHWDGVGWDRVELSFPFRSRLRSVWVEPGSDVVAVGDAGAILRGAR